MAPNVCSRCVEIIHEGLRQDAPGAQKPAKNAGKRRKTAVKAPEEVTPGKVTPDKVNIDNLSMLTGKDVWAAGKVVTPDKVNIDNLLIPAFEHDRKLKSSYKTLFFTEYDKGKVVLSYSGTKLYVNREKVLEIPYPIPRGYFGHLKSGTPSNRVTAIRFYRAYLAEQPEGEKKLKSEKHPEIEQKPSEIEQTKEEDITPVIKYKDGDEAKPEDFHPPGDDGKKKASKLKQSLLSGKNGVVVLVPFAEAERFDYSNLSKNNLGPVVFYENADGRIALK